MIFYFTGTGNSLAAAKALLIRDEALVSITEALNTGAFGYTLKKGERVGFVYPEYAYTVPEPVQRFVGRLVLTQPENRPFYTYAVVTCGGKVARSAAYLRVLLAKQGIRLHNAFILPMPNNGVFWTPVSTGEEVERILKKAEERIGDIREDTAARRVRPVRGSWFGRFGLLCMRAINTTKPFHATEKCVGCGMCVKNCPVKAIRMIDGKPVWVEKSCAMCTACINRCPVHAIEYGKNSAKNGQYVHPTAFR